MNEVVRGALAGLAGTAAHSVVMAGGKSLGFMPVPAPVEVTENVMRKTGVDETPEGADFTAAWVSSHVAYGMGSGVLFGMIRPMLPSSPVAAGLLFGGAVWAVSYFGIMPKLGLYPSPDEDYEGRAVVMALAHAAFGIAAAEAYDGLR